MAQCFIQICPTSSKVHTTRTYARAIGVRNNSQIILFDTPGLVTEEQIKKHKLSNEFIASCRHSIQNSDFIGVIHDVSISWTRNELHSTVLDTLKTYANVPSFLVLNKVDCLKSKRSLLDVTRALTQNTLIPKGIGNPKKFMRDNKLITYDKEKVTGWSGFSDVFMVSSLTGDGMEGVMVRKTWFIVSHLGPRANLKYLIFRNFYLRTQRAASGNMLAENTVINHLKL